MPMVCEGCRIRLLAPCLLSSRGGESVGESVCTKVTVCVSRQAVYPVMEELCQYVSRHNVHEDRGWEKASGGD